MPVKMPPTQELFDRFLELQRRRKEIIKAITG
jgi:hypothetical protein